VKINVGFFLHCSSANISSLSVNCKNLLLL
jgi:hypothetical protein